MIHRQPPGQRVAAAFKLLAQRERFRLHPLLNLFARLVQRIQFIGQHPRFADVIAQQQRHADRHIIQPACRIQPRSEGKSEVAGRQLLRIAVGNLQQRFDTRTALTGTDTAQPLPGENAVIGIQRHDVSHRPERDQIQQLGKIRRRDAPFCKPVFIAQERAQRQHQIKRHPDAGQRFRGEIAVAQIGVHNRFRRRQRLTR